MFASAFAAERLSASFTPSGYWHHTEKPSDGANYYKMFMHCFQLNIDDFHRSPVTTGQTSSSWTFLFAIPVAIATTSRPQLRRSDVTGVSQALRPGARRARRRPTQRPCLFQALQTCCCRFVCSPAALLSCAWATAWQIWVSLDVPLGWPRADSWPLPADNKYLERVEWDG